MKKLTRSFMESPNHEIIKASDKKSVISLFPELKPSTGAVSMDLH